jgi:hypothetical protein
VVLDNLREGVLTPDIYEPTLNPLYRDVLQHYDVTALPCRVQDPDRQGKVESGVAMPRRRRSKGNASRAWKTRKLTRMAGKRAGPTHAFMEPPSGKLQRCSLKSARHYFRCRSNFFAITNRARGPCTWMVASKSKRPTTAACGAWKPLLVGLRRQRSHRICAMLLPLR